MMNEEFFNWQMTCDRFAQEGDVRGMRACAAEVRSLQVPGAAAEADAMEAEAALYGGDAETAEHLARSAVEKDAHHFRGCFALAGALGAQFKLASELPLLATLTHELEAALLPGRAKEAGIMKDILTAKVAVPEMKEKLLATGDATLVEGNRHHDNIWGYCTCDSCRAKNKLGLNRLGNILMEIRDSLS